MFHPRPRKPSRWLASKTSLTRWRKSSCAPVDADAGLGEIAAARLSHRVLRRRRTDKQHQTNRHKAWGWNSLFCRRIGDLFSLPAADPFVRSRHRGKGARVDTINTRGASSGRARVPRRVLRAFEVKRYVFFSRDCFPRRRAAQDHGNPTKLSYPLCCCCITPSFQLSSRLVCGTRQSHPELFLFVTGVTDGASACACVPRFPLV